MPPVFLGIDLGTSGMRVVALSEQGEVVAKSERQWDPPETNPGRWLRTLKALLGQLTAQLGEQYSIAALSACSTSGTILPVDGRGMPLEQAWLYSDPRGQAQAKQFGIPASWGLSRWLWWAEAYPDQYRDSYLAHPADFLLSQLGGAQAGDRSHPCPQERFRPGGLHLASGVVGAAGPKPQAFPRGGTAGNGFRNGASRLGVGAGSADRGRDHRWLCRATGGRGYSLGAGFHQLGHNPYF